MLDFLARMMVTVPFEPVRSNTIFPDKKYLPRKEQVWCKTFKLDHRVV